MIVLIISSYIRVNHLHERDRCDVNKKYHIIIARYYVTLREKRENKFKCFYIFINYIHNCFKKYIYT